MNVRFLPSFCPDFVKVSASPGLEDTGDRKERPAGGRRKDFKLELPFWMAAWDSYAVAAAVLGQVLEHIIVC